MNVEELIKYFQTHKGAIKRSSLETSRRTKSLKHNVIKAKLLFRELAHSNDLHQQHSKILIFDIETAPIKAYVWNMWKENITLDKMISDWFVICWSAKWLYSNEVFGECLSSLEITSENDKRIVEKLWKVFDEADIVIAHNASKFDVPKMNVRFLYHGLNPPSPYRIVDTYKVAKRQFNFSSNKLDALAIFFGFKRKLDTDFNLWKMCMQGNQKALNYMFEYNKHDVELLEEIYLKLLPWIHSHPNIANYINSALPLCCNCGSSKLVELQNKYYKTLVGTYSVYRCKDCGALSRGRAVITKNKLSTVPLIR